MAESPAYWSYSDRVIAMAMKQQDENMRAGLIGWSTPRLISEALEKAGLIQPEKRQEHNHFTMQLQPDTCLICAEYLKQQKEADTLI